jgi:hypothetical protein
LNAAIREKNGMNYDYDEGDWNRLPDFSGLKSKKSGITEGFIFRIS